MKVLLTIISLVILTTFSFGQSNENLTGRLHNGKGIYKSDGKFGFVNYVGKINYLYDSINSPTTDKYAFALKGKHWGVIDFENKVVIPFEYEQIQETLNKNQLSQDTFIVQKNRLLGTIDFRNKIVIPIKYEAISGFCETNIKGHYVSKNGKTGIIDNTGNIVIPTEYDLLYYYSKSTIKAKRNGKYGVINSRNEIIIPFVYDSLFYDFEKFMLDSERIDKFVSKKNNIWYYLDNHGKRIRERVPPEEIMNKYDINKFDDDFKYIKACTITIK